MENLGGKKKKEKKEPEMMKNEQFFRQIIKDINLKKVYFEQTNNQVSFFTVSLL
jgi:hypothetical protein